MKAIRLLVLCAIAFMFIAAPIYMDYPVMVNGKRLANAQNFNGNFYVSVEDLQKVMNGTVLVQGNQLNLAPAPTQASTIAGAAGGGGMGRAAAAGGAGAGKVTFNPFSITRKIDKASPVFFFQGKAFVNVNDLGQLFGVRLNLNGGTLRAGQTIQINSTNAPGAAIFCCGPIGAAQQH